MSETKLTQAQIDQENEREQCVAYDWMTRHPAYIRNNHNGVLIGDYIKELNLPFTEESLDEAFEYLSSHGLFDSTPAPDADATAAVAPPIADLPPWGTTLTKVWLRNASKEQLRSILKSKWGTAFEEAVRQLKIQRSV